MQKNKVEIGSSSGTSENAYEIDLSEQECREIIRKFELETEDGINVSQSQTGNMEPFQQPSQTTHSDANQQGSKSPAIQIQTANEQPMLASSSTDIHYPSTNDQFSGNNRVSESAEDHRDVEISPTENSLLKATEEFTESDDPIYNFFEENSFNGIEKKFGWRCLECNQWFDSRYTPNKKHKKCDDNLQMHLENKHPHTSYKLLKQKAKREEAKLEKELNGDLILTFFELLPKEKYSPAAELFDKSTERQWKCLECGERFDCRYNSNGGCDNLREHLARSHKMLFKNSPVNGCLDPIADNFVRCKLCGKEMKRYYLKKTKKGGTSRTDWFRQHLRLKHTEIFENKVKWFRDIRSRANGIYIY